MDPFEIVTIPGKGRAMISKKHFSEGDIIFEEEAFVSCQFSWNAAYGYLCCDHCMRPLETVEENVRRLANDKTVSVPLQEHDPTKPWMDQFCMCVQCGVKYCSQDCQVDSWKKYHSAACMGNFRQDDTHPINVLNDAWMKMHYPPEMGTILLIVRIMAMYKQSKNKEEFLETLKSFQSVFVNTEDQIVHKMIGPNFESQMLELYKQFCNAFQNEEFAIFTTPDAFKSLMALIGTNSQGVATSVFSGWVKKVLDLSLPEEEKGQLETCIDELYTKVGEFSGEFLNNEGSGLYQLQSKINHSCIPNAESNFPYSNHVVALKALKDIQPGEEICISYLDECQLERSRHTRHAILKENYLFVCSCPRCLEQANDPDETSEDEEEEEELEGIDDDDNM